MRRVVVLALFILLICPTSYATHIVGGDLTFECLGGNQFRFTLNVYRDCFGGQAPFDNNVNFAVYTGNGVLFNTFSSPKQSENPIAIDLSNPCLIPPPGVCVERALYEEDITLPFNSLGYFVVWQRCCRNGTISNIANPNQAGATFNTFVSPTSLTSCNSSPTFNNFPPVVICQNQPINFDHGATDVDGDSLVYSFCAPSLGGGQGNPVPNPATPPPYSPVAFLPPYTASAPLASNVAIDPSTGFITGSPTTTGQYVVGICVDEYRNGVWLGSIKRDFQFNVGTCAVSVQAGLTSDSLTANGTFIIESCVDTSITFQNQSGQAQFISGYLWEFNNNGTIISSTAANPTISFSGPGTYIGTMIVNPNSTGCSDTAYVSVKINRNPVSSFSFTYDSCVIGPIDFTSNSFSLDGTIAKWDWDFGDDSTIINQEAPSYQYQDAGTFDVRLLVTDDIGCIDSSVQTLTWAPTPIIDVVPSTASGCIPLDVLLENNSYPINGYSLFWTLGDGYTSTLADPVHTYQDTGLYTVTVYIESPLGCSASDTFPNLVNVRNPPTPDFYFFYDSCEYSPVNFYNASTQGDGDILNWNWSFENDSTITTQGTQVTHQYPEIGTYNATLSIIDANNCELSLSKTVDWQPAPVFPVELPNFVGCEPLTIEVSDSTYPLDGYFTMWNFGDGYYSDNFNDVHTYENAGLYDMSLTVVSRTACFEEFTFPGQVTVNDNPIADFAFAPDDENLPNIFEPRVDFFDQSTNASAWNWTIGTEAISIEQNPVHSFQDSGLQVVTLVVTHPNGCQDSTSQVVDVKPSFTYYLPNAFTPNDDGKNDGYRGVGELFGVTNYEMQIWSRWGEIVFQSSDPLEAWNGRMNNSGQNVNAGVYVVLVKMTGPRGKLHEVKGFATVVR